MVWGSFISCSELCHSTAYPVILVEPNLEMYPTDQPVHIQVWKYGRCMLDILTKSSNQAIIPLLGFIQRGEQSG